MIKENFEKYVKRYFEYLNSDSLFGFSQIEESNYIKRLVQLLHLLNDQDIIDLKSFELNSNLFKESFLLERANLILSYDVYEPNSWKNFWLVDYFYNALKINKRKAFLTPFSKEELSKMLLFKVKGADAGFAIKETSDFEGNPTRDIVAVHNNSPVKKIGYNLISDAIKRDGQTLDHFDGFLSKLYGDMGFEPYGINNWEDQYAPTTWEYTPIDILKNTYHADKLSSYKPEDRENKINQYLSGRPDVIYRRVKK